MIDVYKRQVREFVLKKAKPLADDIRTDAIGNVMVFRKGKKALNRPVAVCAHMDEVGVIVKKITEDGMLKFGFVGGVDSRVVIGKGVRLSLIHISCRRIWTHCIVWHIICWKKRRLPARSLWSYCKRRNK